MASFNNCTFSGNVGRDPELRYFDDGKTVANFSIAVEDYKGETMWVSVKVWGKPAQTIADYVRKGSQLIVSGELQQETWEKDGEQKSKMVLRCQSFTFLGSKKEGAAFGNASGGGSPNSGARKPAAKSRPAAPVEEEELPF